MKSLKLFVISVVAAVFVSCGTTNTVPITGRQQTLMVSDGEVLSLSTQQYQEFMKTAKLSTNQANTQMVKRVGQNLANAVVNYLRMRLRSPLCWVMRLHTLWPVTLLSR